MPENLIQSSLLADLGSLLFPDVCIGCSDHLQQNEDIICTFCKYELPKTSFHGQRGNPIEKIFWGRVPVVYATSYLFFHKGGIVQHMLHGLKYKGMQEVGSLLGRMMGQEILSREPFNTIDVIVPVPLHPRKLKIRGYNQCTSIAKGMEESSGIPALYKGVLREVNNPSQTRKGRFQRWENVKTAFGVDKPEILQGKHVLLIDDVVTTGATLEACAQTLLQIKDVRVSMATVACA